MKERIGRALPAAVVVAVVFALAIGDGGRHIETMVFAQSAVLLGLAIAVASGAARDLRPAAPITIMIGAVALTAIPSVWPDSSVRELVLWVTYAAIAMLAATGLKDSREWFVDGVVLTAGWLCLVALFWFWGSGNIAARWSSTFYWPNPFAAFLLLVLPLTLVRALRAPTTRVALAHGAATVLFAIALVFTYSRGAWAAGLLALIATAIVLRPVRWRTAALRAGVIALAVVGCVWILGRAVRSGTTNAVAARAASLADAGDASAHGHYLFWIGALEIFRDHPIVGTGPNTFGAIYASYQREVNYYARDAHSLYLQTASDMGVVGLLALAVLLVWAGRAWWRMLRRARDDGEYTLIAGVGLGLLAFLIHNAVDMDWSFPANPATAFALAGVLARVTVDQHRSDATPAAGGRQRAATVAVLLAALVAAQCWGQGNRSFQRGQAYARVENWEAAAAAFSAAERWNPLSARYLIAEGGARVRMRPPDRARAVAAMRRAIRLDPMNAPHRLELARIIATAPGAGPDAFAEAERLLRSALELDPLNRPRIYQTLIAVYGRWDRRAEVESLYVASVDRYLGPARGPGALPLPQEVLDLLVEAADFHAREGDGTAARRVIERTVLADPNAASYPRVRTLADSLR
jgi:O-antigen ligase